MVAWKEALNCYSRDSDERPLTAVEEQLKEACEEGLKRAQEDLSLEEQKPFKSNRLGIDASEIDEQLLPWKVAARMEADIKRIGPSSVKYTFVNISLTLIVKNIAIGMARFE